MVLFSRIFADAKFRENLTIAKCQINDAGKVCYSRPFLT